MRLFTLLTGEWAGSGVADLKARPVSISRRLTLIALFGSILQFLILKLLFPFPDFISDSYSYIATNLYHMKVNLWPVGYSWFLAGIHAISSSDILLLAVQYVLLQAALLYFFYVISYLYQPSKSYALILYVFLLFNPACLYLANCVLSDALFCALTIAWFCELLLLLHDGKPYHLVTLAVLTGLLFTIRYTAAYYPLVSGFGIVLSRLRLPLKLAGVVLPAVFIVPFISYTQQETKKATGTAEFSVFGGWQIGNNALYMYDHITVDSTKLPPETVKLDRMVRQFFAKYPSETLDLQHFPGTFFIKVYQAPLKDYVRRYSTPIKDDPSEFVAWGKVSPIYNKYGNYLITHHMVAFAQYYLLLNTKNYFFPHLEKFGSYNIREKEVWPLGQYWFGYDKPNVTVYSADLLGTLFYGLPGFFLMLNIFFAGSIVIHLRRNGRDKVAWLAVTFILANFAFSVFATPVVIRYQVFPMILLFTFSVLFIERKTPLLQNQIKSNV